jgi:hypothetical protein
MRATIAARQVDRRLFVGPSLLVLGLVLLKVSDVLVVIGPLDRAAFGWSLPVPMILLAPGAVGAAAHWSGPGPARRTAAITGGVLGIAVGAAWFASTTQVQCDPHPSAATVLFASLPVPIVLGAGWAGAGRFAVRFADRPALAVAAGVLGAIIAGAIALATWAVLFPGLSCGYVPPA